MNVLRHIGLAALCLSLCGWKPALARTAPGIIVEADPQANPWTHMSFKNDPDAFQFAIVADRTGGHRPGVFEDAVRKLNILQPEFVMSVGDLIEGYSEDSTEVDRQWTEFGALVKPLQMPFFYVPGNHDITNQTMAARWQKRFGRSYYDFVYRNVLFVCLSSQGTAPTRISEEEVGYVADALSRHRDARWTLVFLHHPLWLYEDESGWGKVEALLQGRPYTVFAGHFHQYTKYERHDQRYFILSTTGGDSQLRGPVFGEFDHIAWVTMTSQGPRVANLLLNGIWDEDVRNEKIAALVDPFEKGEVVFLSPILTDRDIFDKAASELQITNKADLPMKVTGSFEPSADLRASPDRIDLMVPANSVERRELEFRVDHPMAISDIAPLVMNWSASYELPDRPPVEVTGTHRLAVDRRFECPGRSTPVVVDGRLDEWPQMPLVCSEPRLILMDQKSWQGPDDCSFRFAVEHDEQNLYIAVETTDERLVIDPGKFPWQQDGIEVRLDARPDPMRSSGRGEGEFKEILLVALSPGETPDKMVYHNREQVPAGTKAICVTTPTGHATEISVPVAYLKEKQGEAWTAFRLNITVDDFDNPSGPGSQIWWRPDWRNAANYVGSGTFKRM